MLTVQQRHGGNEAIWLPQRSPLQELRDFPFFPDEEAAPMQQTDNAAGPGWLVALALAMLAITITAEIIVLALLLR